jgi:hypothetical protein
MQDKVMCLDKRSILQVVHDALQTINGAHDISYIATNFLYAIASLKFSVNQLRHAFQAR